MKELSAFHHETRTPLSLFEIVGGGRYCFFFVRRRPILFHFNFHLHLLSFYFSFLSFMFPRSMSAMDFSTYTKRDNVASISSSFEFLQFSPSNKNTSNEFLGVSLPLDLSTLFQVRYCLFLFCIFFSWGGGGLGFCRIRQRSKFCTHVGSDTS